MNKPEKKNLAECPFVSVIMPVRNEAAFIERSLGAILAQDYPPDRIEIIIADGMSTDSTRRLIEKSAAASDIAVAVVDNPSGIAPTGLNAALRKSVGEIIVRVDGHTIIEPDYVRECVAALRKSDACNVGGRMNAISENNFGNVIALATSSPFGIGNARFHYSEREEYADTVYLGAWRRKVFEEFGLFDEQLVRNQDDEFNYRLRAAGGRILLCPKIKSFYYNRSSLKSLWRQYYQYGYWKVRVLQMHPRQMSARQFVPFIFVAAIILTAMAEIFSSVGKWALLLLIVSYAIANFAASIWTAKAKVRLIPLLVLSFAILHLSYGSGFLMGLISFRKKWGEKNVRIHSVPQL